MQQLHSNLLAMQKPTLLKALLQGLLSSVLALHDQWVGNILPKYFKTLNSSLDDPRHLFADGLMDKCLSS